MQSPSPESLVDLIFGKCALVYGRDFSGRWEGMDIAEVKADWLRELGPLLANPQAIRYGLENLPERPPTVLAFRALCGSMPPAPYKALPVPAADPEKVKAAMKKMRSLADGLRMRMH